MRPAPNLTEKVANSIRFANTRWKKSKGRCTFLVMEEARAAIKAVREWDRRTASGMRNGT
jgi:hypothetical protein